MKNQIVEFMAKKKRPIVIVSKLKKMVEDRQENELKTLLPIIYNIPKSEFTQFGVLNRDRIYDLTENMRNNGLSHIEYLTLVMIANLVSQKK